MNNPLVNNVNWFEPLEQRQLASVANVVPTLTVTPWMAEYVEDGVPVAIDPGLRVSDPDSMIVGATVRIAENFVPGEDSLVFSDQLGITGSWDPVTGGLALTGSATPADYQAALRSVAYVNSSHGPSEATRAMTFTVSDGALQSPARTRMLAVIPMNDAPEIMLSGHSAVFVEDAGSVVLDPELVLSDVDSDIFWGAMVQITGNYAPAEDSLVFTDQLGITGSWDPETGTLMLSGFEPLAAYQLALRTVRYANSSQDPSTAARTMSFEITDGALPSPIEACNVGVVALNEVPILTGSGASASYVEDAAPVTIDAALALGDPDSATLASATIAITGNYRAGEDRLVFSDQLGITGSWNPATGTLTLTGFASPAEYQTALRSVAYVNTSQNPSALIRTVTTIVNDGLDASAPVTTAVTVSPVNDAPTAMSSAGPAIYTAGGAAVPVDAGVVLGDVDSPMIASAVVRISGNFVAGQDTLVFTAQAGITGVWEALTGTLILSGAASVAAYQDAMRSVKYLNTSSSPSTAVRTVTMVVVDDLGSESAEASRSLELVAAPAPPTPGRPGCPHSHHPHPRSHSHPHPHPHTGPRGHSKPPADLGPDRTPPFCSIMLWRPQAPHATASVAGARAQEVLQRIAGERPAPTLHVRHSANPPARK